MPRVLLTAEEKEARRKAKVAQYFAKQKINPTGERGSPEQWRKMAEQMLFGHGGDIALAPVDEILQVMGLNAMPTDLAALKKARNAALQKAHPDHFAVMGAEAATAAGNVTKAILAAYEELKEKVSA